MLVGVYEMRTNMVPPMRAINQWSFPFLLCISAANAFREAITLRLIVSAMLALLAKIWSFRVVDFVIIIALDEANPSSERSALSRSARSRLCGKNTFYEQRGW